MKRIRDLEVPEGADGDKAKEWQDAVASEAEDQLIPALDELKKAADENDEEALVAAAQKIEGLESGKSDALARTSGLRGVPTDRRASPCRVRGVPPRTAGPRREVRS